VIIQIEKTIVKRFLFPLRYTGMTLRQNKKAPTVVGAKLVSDVVFKLLFFV
jgi:hypothetical protein